MIVNSIYRPAAYNMQKMKGNSEIKDTQTSTSNLSVEEQNIGPDSSDLTPMGKSNNPALERNRADIIEEFKGYYLKPEQMDLINKKMKEKLVSDLNVNSYLDLSPQDYAKHEVDPYDTDRYWRLARVNVESKFGNILAQVIFDNFNGLVDENGNKIKERPIYPERPEYSEGKCLIFASEFMERLGKSMLKTAIGIGDKDPGKSYKMANLAYKCLDGASEMADKVQHSNWYRCPDEVIYRAKMDPFNSMRCAGKYMGKYGDYPVGSDKFNIFYADREKDYDPTRINRIVKYQARIRKNPADPENRRSFFSFVQDITKLDDNPSGNLACAAVTPFIKALPEEERFFGFTEVLDRISMKTLKNSGHLAVHELYSVLDSLPGGKQEEARTLLQEKDPGYEEFMKKNGAKLKS